MTEREKLTREIETVRVWVRGAWREMAEEPMTGAERGAYRTAISMMVADLHDLLERMDELDAQGS
jgi:hypothetical protein